MKKVKLHNSFHRTEVTILIDDDLAELSESAIYQELQRPVFSFLHPDKNAVSKLRRVEKALCGMTDCCCGTVR